jgi:hypothetical protein
MTGVMSGRGLISRILSFAMPKGEQMIRNTLLKGMMDCLSVHDLFLLMSCLS